MPGLDETLAELLCLSRIAASFLRMKTAGYSRSMGKTDTTRNKRVMASGLLNNIALLCRMRKSHRLAVALLFHPDYPDDHHWPPKRPI
jgi:hypothetical protein